MKKNNRLLIIGNFLSKSVGIRSVGEETSIRLTAKGWRIIETSAKINRLSRLYDMVSTVITHRQDYDVALVEVYSNFAFYWAEITSYLLQRLHKKIILVLHGGGLPLFGKRYPKRLAQLLCRGDLLVSPSYYLIDELSRYKTPIHYIPNAIEISRYPFRLRKNLKPRIVWLRAFHNIYNPQVAPKVFADVKQKYPDSELFMIGPDKGDGSLAETKKTALEHGVNSSIQWIGGVQKKDVPRWMDIGDIYINTTNVDNAPVTVTEASACGLCIVSTNVGGLPYLLTHEHNGLLVSSGDSVNMANSIIRLLNEPELAGSLSGNARKTAEKHDWSLVLPRWEELITSIQ